MINLRRALARKGLSKLANWWMDWWPGKERMKLVAGGVAAQIGRRLVREGTG